MHDHRPPRAARQTGVAEEAYYQDQSIAPARSMPSASRHRSEESWVEIGSRPSSSSLSSAADEIITTGLTVQHDSNIYRRNRRARGGGRFQIGTGQRVANTGGNSSQEEYEESESESDRVMTSSNEGLQPSPLRNELHPSTRSPHSIASSETASEREEDGDDDDDENATAVNYPRSTGREFQPRPNAFSHPNSQHAVRSQSGTVYTPRRAARPTSHRQHTYPQNSTYASAPSHGQTDHDEALRASLSTLLSAAAAVRGLPKPGQPRAQPTTSTRVDPTSLRLVPESVAMGEVSDETISSPRTTSSSPSDKSKRKASPPGAAGARSSSKDRRNVKKVRRTGPLIEEISPTLLTWVVSAGVVVLVSALSFSAGYVVGKEAGHAEVLGQIGSTSSEAGSCAKEAVSGLKGGSLGLRKLRWAGSAGIHA